MKRTAAIKLAVAIWWVGCLSLACLAGEINPVYQNDFEAAELNKVPEEFVVLDGAFAVKQDQGMKFLELPGAPLDTFVLLFGPNQEAAVASIRVYGTSKGRRLPTFAVGLNGMGGYRLQVSPGKKALELIRGDSLKTSVPYEWESGKWTHLRLEVRKTGDGWVIEGKAWPEGKDQPASPSLSFKATDALPAGRASIFGSPFSGTPIRYDDLLVARVGET